MEHTKNLSESDLYWYRLIQECRSSGISDAQWLKQNKIKSSTFYYHVKKLRQKACDIPDNHCTMRQPEVHEVVPICLGDTLPSAVPSHNIGNVSHCSSSIDAAIRQKLHGVCVEITNAATQTAIQNTWQRCKDYVRRHLGDFQDLLRHRMSE